MLQGSSMEALVPLPVYVPSILLVLLPRLFMVSKQNPLISLWFAWKLGPLVIMPIL